MAERKGNTHIVVKKADAKKYLGKGEYDLLNLLAENVNVERQLAGKSSSYYICNIDEPYADKVLQVILDGEDKKEGKVMIDEKRIEKITSALRICNNSKGHRCSECPVFSRYDYRVCKKTVDKIAVDIIESLQLQLAEYEKIIKDYQNIIMPQLREQLAESQTRSKKVIESLQLKLKCRMEEIDQLQADFNIENLNLEHMTSLFSESQAMVKEVIEDFCAVARLVGTFPTKDDYKDLCALEAKWLKTREKIL